MKKHILSLAAMLGVFVTTNGQCFDQTMYSTGSAPVDIVTADFNRDGILDIATCNKYANTISILTGTGNGTFSAPVDFPTNNDPTAITVGDFNNDTILDIVTVNGSGVHSIGILIGVGNGTFASSLNMGVGVTWPFDVVAADVNNDGNLDLISSWVTSNLWGTSQIFTHLGNGDGTFSYQSTLTVAYGNYIVFIEDLNNDNNKDIVVMRQGIGSNPSAIGSKTGDGTGTFNNTNQSWHWIYQQARDFTAADFNQDGRLDYVTANSSYLANDTNNLLVIGLPNAQLDTPYHFGINTRTYNVRAGDFNNDGHMDFVASADSSRLILALGNGNATFSSPIIIQAQVFPRYITTGDFNGDGRLDIAGTDINADTVTVFLQECACGYISTTPAGCQSAGSAKMNITNGIGPFTYLWNTGATNDSIGNLSPGVYSVTITGSNGCQVVRTDSIASVSLAIDSIHLTPTTCAASADGSVTVYPSGSNPPFSYLWTTNDTTQTLSGLTSGTYNLTVTDSAGCSYVQPITITETGLQVQIEALATAGDCSSPNDGILAAVPTNGTGPYNYSWSNGGSTDTLTGLAVGQYVVTTTDFNGCSIVKSGAILPDISCYSTLSGNIYYDDDENCTKDTLDVGINNRMVAISPGYYALSNAQGDWHVNVPTGNYKVYTITSQLTPNSCNIDTLTVPVLDSLPISNLDLPKYSTPIYDVSAQVNCGVARPGASEILTFTLKNKGNRQVAISGVITLDAAYNQPPSIILPSGFVLDSVTLNPHYLIYFHNNAWQAQAFSQINIVASIPTAVWQGQNLTNTVSINIINQSDANTTDNNATCTSSVIASYDPNDKQVFSNGVTVDGNAAAEDTLLTYRIRFQNTGNDTAFRVVVVDTLDAALEITTFELLAASHAVEIDIKESHILHFIFDNILLPDSNVNEPASHGFVDFQLKVRNPEILGPISNQGAIYFDFNTPIFTNTVITNRMVQDTTDTTGLAIINDINPIKVYPNPANNTLTISTAIPMDGTTLALYNLLGENVLNIEIRQPIQQIDVSQLVPGVYTFGIKQNGKALDTGRVVILR